MIKPTIQRITALAEFLGTEPDRLWDMSDEEFGLIAETIFEWYNALGERHVRKLQELERLKKKYDTKNINQ
jgi:hypothetical protein